MILMAALLLTATAYAQLEIRRYTAGGGRVLLTRSLLILVGAAFGYVSAAGFAGDPMVAVLVFLIGFGTVHTPAALILLLKQQSGAGKS